MNTSKPKSWAREVVVLFGVYAATWLYVFSATFLIACLWEVFVGTVNFGQAIREHALLCLEWPIVMYFVLVWTNRNSPQVWELVKRPWCGLFAVRDYVEHLTQKWREEAEREGRYEQ